MTDVASVRAEIEAVLRRTASFNSAEIDMGSTGPFALLEEPLRTAVVASFSVVVRHGEAIVSGLDDTRRLDLLVDPNVPDTDTVLPDAVIEKYLQSDLSIREKIDHAITYIANRENIASVADAHDAGALEQQEPRVA